MLALELLKREHRAIERVLDSIDVIVAAVAAGREVPWVFEAILEFIDAYADGRHHAKEEGILFEAMIARGMPSESGPIACMLSEHALLRGLGRRMHQLLRTIRNGEATQVASLGAAATLYSRALAHHIMKEDHMLYPLAERTLPADVLEAMLSSYAQVDPEGIVAYETAASGIAQMTLVWHEEIGAGGASVSSVAR